MYYDHHVKLYLKNLVQRESFKLVQQSTIYRTFPFYFQHWSKFSNTITVMILSCSTKYNNIIIFRGSLFDENVQYYTNEMNRV